MTGRLMPVAHGRLAGGGCPAEAVEAGEAQRQVLLVDPDLAAVPAVDVVTLVEVEAPVADPADGGGGLLDRLRADCAGRLVGCHGGDSTAGPRRGRGLPSSSFRGWP